MFSSFETDHGMNTTSYAENLTLRANHPCSTSHVRHGRCVSESWRASLHDILVKMRTSLCVILQVHAGFGHPGTYPVTHFKKPG